jgi:putative flippase GtrA
VTTIAAPPSSLPALSAESQRAELTGAPPVEPRAGVEQTARRERVRRVVRALLVGGAASLLDLGLLSAGIRWAELGATVARLVALVASTLLLFFGSRSFAFRAQAGNISQQAKLFVVCEAAGLVLNLVIFRLIVTHAAALPPEIASQLANTLVFVAFSYPLRALVIFRVRATESARDGSVELIAQSSVAAADASARSGDDH